jgi:hypothetical protein
MVLVIIGGRKCYMLCQVLCDAIRKDPNKNGTVLGVVRHGARVAVAGRRPIFKGKGAEGQTEPLQGEAGVDLEGLCRTCI